MTSKKFIFTTFAIFFLITIIIVGTNYFFDDFGLFRTHSERRIWAREKTSKYLMAFKYIPENFDAVLVGSSVSANMDTRKLNGYKVFNLSMNNGNITELKYPLDVLIGSGKIKAVIFCLYDYTTKDSGVKGNQLSEKEYWGSLYSTIPFDVLKCKIKYKLLNREDVFEKSDNGYNNFNISNRNIVFREVVEGYMKSPRTVIYIDSVAYDEFKSILIKLRRNNIKIYAYFYPIYKEWFNLFLDNGEWDEYKSKMMSLFNRETDVIWDMNTGKYDYFTNNLIYYSDGHLSDEGAETLINVINSQLSKIEMNR